MKSIFTLILLLLASELVAQNYSCIPPDQKTYFTNARGYLRGMRIDSIKNIDGNTVYYPFKTARTAYMDWAAIADTAGGSWWGKSIIETPAGLTIIQNYRGDSVIINTAADLGDSWTFFKDSSAIHYKAEVTGINTITINNQDDSVKTIRITALDINNSIIADSVNGVEIKLSKHHGLIKALDFYLFPYRQTDGSYNTWFDCYFSEATGSSAIPTSEHWNLTFDRVNLKIPYGYSIFDYNIEDEFWDYKSTSFDFNAYTRVERKYVITGKTVSDTNIVYSFDHETITTNYTGTSAPQTGTSSGSDSLAVVNDIMMDTTFMPEEYHGDYMWYYYYLPEDSSYCFASVKYGFYRDKIIMGRFGGGGPEPSFPFSVYKEGLGLLSYSTGGSVINGTQQSGGLNGAKKQQTFWCGSGNGVLSVESRNKLLSQIKLYPNPSDNEVCIESGSPLTATVILVDMLGREKLTKKLVNGNKIILSVKDLSSGIYFVKIGVKDDMATLKIVVQH